MTSVAVYSIFTSIQGESTHAGRPCTFVRLAGCPLECSYCDTLEARSSKGEEIPTGEVVARVARRGCALVEVTGGEPLHQKGAKPLIVELLDAGFEVLVETSGAFSIAGVDERASVVMDVKTPGSGMAKRMDPDNLARIAERGDQVKFVITSADDFTWSERLIEKEKLEGRCEILFSPVAGKVDGADLARWLLESGLRARLQLQLHKIIWPLGETER